MVANAQGGETTASLKRTPLELSEELQDPLAHERWSAFTGEPSLLLDLSGGATLPENLVARVGEQVRDLPAVVVAMAAPPIDHPLAHIADVVADSDEEALTVVMRTREHPLASLALVQLLRMGEHLSIHEALQAESFVYSMLQAGPEFGDWLASRAKRPSASTEDLPLRVTREAGLLHIRFDRPSMRNAFSVGMRDALCEALGVALWDSSIERIVLSGEGPAFCSGGDLSEFGSLPDPASAHAIRSTRSPARLMSMCGPKLEARVHGACVGAGAELPAFCAEVIAREDAFFQLPELGMGLVPGAGGTASLPSRIGRQRTAWLALSGNRIGADQALAWGLVDRICSSIK